MHHLPTIREPCPVLIGHLKRGALLRGQESNKVDSCTKQGEIDATQKRQRDQRHGEVRKGRPRADLWRLTVIRGSLHISAEVNTTEKSGHA